MIPAIIRALIPILVTQAEKLFGGKTGDIKRAWVTESANAAAQKLATAGKLGGPAPSADLYASHIDDVVAEMNRNGGFNAVENPKDALGEDVRQMLRKLVIWALR